MKKLLAGFSMLFLLGGFCYGDDTESVIMLPKGATDTTKWKYTLNFPDSEPFEKNEIKWNEAGYDDGRWIQGKAPFSNLDASMLTVNTELPKKAGNCFFRGEFNLGNLDGVSYALLQFANKGELQIFINGKPLVENTSSKKEKTNELSYWNREFEIEPSLLHPGNNILAVSLKPQGDSKEKYFDFQLTAFKDKSQAVLQVIITDRDSKLPLDTRCYVKGSDNKWHGPKDTLYYGDGRFYSTGYFQLVLPAGKTELSVCRGPEYEVKTENIELLAGKLNVLEVSIGRFGINLPKEKWFGGDAQVQYAGHGEGKTYWGHFYDLGTKGLMPFLANLACRAEGYTFGISRIGTGPEFLDCSFEGAENWTQFNGHTDLLMDTSPEITKLRNAEMAAGGYELYPGPFANIERYQIMYQYGGLAYPAHPKMGPFNDPSRSSGWGHNREYPIELALGRMRCFNVGTSEGETFSEWLSALNLGFKLTAINETDAYLNWGPGVGPATYLKIDESTSFNAIEAYKKGKVCVGYGPLVFFKIDGKEIGDTLYLKDKKELNVEIYAQAFFGIDKIQIVRNGIVAAEIPGEGQQILKKTVSLPPATGYVMAKCYGKPNKFFGTFAYTNPVYVQVEGESLKPKPEDIDPVIEHIRKYRELFNTYCKISTIKRWAPGNPKCTSESLIEAGVDPNAPMEKDVVDFQNKLIDEAEKSCLSIKDGHGPDFQENFHPFIKELDDINPDKEWGFVYEKTLGHLPPNGLMSCLGTLMHLCYDPLGNLYVGAGAGGTLQKFDPDGKLLWTGSSLWSLASMVADERNVYMIGHCAGLQVLDAKTGKTAEIDFTLPQDAGGMQGTLLLYKNLLFVKRPLKDKKDWKVLVFDTNTGILLNSADSPKGDFEALSEYKDVPSPFAKKEVSYPDKLIPGMSSGRKTIICADNINPVNQDIAVPGKSCFVIFSKDGEFKRILEQVIKPSDIAVDKEGRILVLGADENGGKIYAPNGDWVENLPKGNVITCDENSGDIFIADEKAISRLDSKGKLLGRSPEACYFKTPGLVSGVKPVGCLGMAVYNGDLYFTSYSERKIKKVKVEDIATELPEDLISELFQPTGIAFDSKGNLYVALSGGHKLRKYVKKDESWTLAWERGTVPTRGREQFRYPRGLSVEGDKIYVADWNNNRIKIYDLDGKLLKVLGSVGSGDYNFNRPTRAIVRKIGGTSYLIVCDVGNRRVMMYKEKP